MVSVTPLTYMSAVSMNVTPASSARSMISIERASSTCRPKVIVPRQKAETFRPVRPSFRYSIAVPSACRAR
jgi:hypothetical protein